MTQEEKKALLDTIGDEATKQVQKELTGYEAKVKAFAEEAVKNGNLITEKSFNDYKEAADKALDAIKEIAVKQGTTLTDVVAKMETQTMGTKSIGEVLEESKEDLRKVYQQGQGQKTFMINVNQKGDFVMAPFDATKAVGPNATISGIAEGTIASITQGLDAATLLRVGAGSQIQSQYRNSSWIFDLCNTIRAGFNSSMPFAMWFDELAKDGSSATVAEGATKPSVQYKYQLNSASYKKEAALVGFTQEFALDFAQLESDIRGKAAVDVINHVNSSILPRIKAAATAYNTGTEFQGGTPVADANDFDVIAAMAAQVDNATFGANANAALMATFKKYRMGIIKNSQYSYLNPPDVLSNIAFIGNPDMGTDDVIVGDLKQYNILLRGGLIVRVGFNGTDFAQNMYSVVLEQFYFDYISNVRKAAIVKGPGFSDVKTAIGA
ncbi:MAG TPA: hypothetical protein VN726_06390 [Hanamia sp.]|nr:hypothetical protein [Hanamia sp.]